MKWIEINDMGKSPSGKTSLWQVVNKDQRSLLGIIKWDSGWRRYVFAASSECIVFEEECLRDIADFVENATKEHKAQVR